jgi:hypothetical protein
MSEPKKCHAVVVMARCNRENASFGIRFEEDAQKNWVGTWAFPVKISSGQREEYEKNSIKGSVSFTEDYPGCPYCKARNIVLCGTCKKVSCYNNSDIRTVCPHCKKSNIVSGHISQLDSGTDR